MNIYELEFEFGTRCINLSTAQLRQSIVKQERALARTTAWTECCWFDEDLRLFYQRDPKNMSIFGLMKLKKHFDF